MTNTNAADVIDKAVSWLDKINGLPGYALVVLGCLCIHYVLRSWRAFPNDGIGVAVILSGGLGNVLVADVAALPMRVWIVRNVLVGFGCGLLAVLAEKLLLARLEHLAKKWLGNHTTPLIVGALLALSITLTGCALFPQVAAGEDKAVVNMERGQAAAFAIVDGFLKAEHDNREFIRVAAPGVHQVAETLRRRAPSAFEAVRLAVLAYKHDRSDESKRQAYAALRAVQSLAGDALGALSQMPTIPTGNQPTKATP